MPCPAPFLGSLAPRSDSTDTISSQPPPGNCHSDEALCFWARRNLQLPFAFVAAAFRGLRVPMICTGKPLRKYPFAVPYTMSQI